MKSWRERGGSGSDLSHPIVAEWSAADTEKPEDASPGLARLPGTGGSGWGRVDVTTSQTAAAGTVASSRNGLWSSSNGRRWAANEERLQRATGTV